MTQPGGPAAINGFLFQIIHHLGWLTEVSFTGTLAGQQIGDACLVLEPRIGGDALAELAGTYVVEQYKNRLGGTWSVVELEFVLRDLRKTVPESLPKNARYRFVTDGRPGRLDTFRAFLADVKSTINPDELDDILERKFSNDIVCTNREFFQRIITATRSGTPKSNQAERAIVFHLLLNFEMEFGATGEARAAAVERLLRRYVPDLGDESKVREHLVGLLVEKLSKGEARLTAEAVNQMFRHVGLSPDRFRRLATLAETISALTDRRFARLKYQPDRDIRDIPNWPSEKPVLLITGESGTGKTWQLGRLIECWREDRQIVTFISGATTRADVLTQVSQDIWQSGLGETSDKTIVAVSRILRELDPNGSIPKLVVALDNLQDIDLARDLIRQDWGDLGMRLVLTVPEPVARSLAMTDGDAIHVHRVDNFSVDELDRLLKQKGERWAYLPEDLKKLLRSPILAGIFVELPYSSFHTAPRSEYEIFEKFWERIAAKGRPADQGILAALADHILQGKPYPVSRQLWQQTGLTEETVTRLESAGWLRTTEMGEVAFVHDRLLNWAVAQFMVWEFQNKRLSLEKLVNILRRETEGRNLSRQLSYVPMDVLWSLAANETNTEIVGKLVSLLEESHHFGSYGEDLYVHLLPTLGQRAIPILLKRLEGIASGSEDEYRAGVICKAFANLARQENVDLENTISFLLNTSSRDQKVAMAALAAAPNTQYLDRLWELHQQRIDALQDQTNLMRFNDYEASFEALRAGVAVEPAWLGRRILSADSEKEHVSELGYLLYRMDYLDASKLWKEAGDILMTKISPGKPRSLLHCIARFSDHQKVNFVTEHLSRREDSASGAALAALTILDPLAAINRLVEVEDFDRYLTRNHWLPAILHAQPKLARERILALAEANPNGRRIIDGLFWERPDEIDGPMLRFVLRSLETELGERFDEIVAGNPDRLYHTLDFLGRITDPRLLNILQNEAGSNLERMIVAVACSRLRTNSNYRDDIRENARKLLILIGGEGITTLIGRELASEHFWIRHSGLTWAFVAEDDSIVDQLAALIRRSVPGDASLTAEPDPPLEFLQAARALAALGPDSVLVDILWQTNVLQLPLDLPEFRAHRGPLSKALTEQVREILQSDGAVENLLLIGLAIAEISGDPSLIPLVLSVLSRADPESRIARFSCIAAYHLRASSEEFARLAFLIAQSKENVWWGLKALIALESSGLKYLEKWLQANKNKTDPTHENFVVRALYRNPKTRKLAIDTAVRVSLEGGSFWEEPYDMAAEAVVPALREKIHDKAFAARAFTVTAPLLAIEGLAKFDAPRAVEAIELGLQSHHRIERELCHLLVKFAPELAAKKLIDAAVSIERESLRRAAGQALRRLDGAIVTTLVLERITGSATVRKAAAEIAGWLLIPEITKALESLAHDDTTIEIRNAALNALERHRREDNIRALFEAFPSMPPKRQWSLLVAIVENGDPYLLTDRQDSLWLGRILRDVPFAFEHYANSVLGRRKKDGDR